MGRGSARSLHIEPKLEREVRSQGIAPSASDSAAMPTEPPSLSSQIRGIESARSAIQYFYPAPARSTSWFLLLPGWRCHALPLSGGGAPPALGIPVWRRDFRPGLVPCVEVCCERHLFLRGSSRGCVSCIFLNWTVFSGAEQLNTRHFGSQECLICLKRWASPTQSLQRPHSSLSLAAWPCCQYPASPQVLAGYTTKLGSGH